jgi:hypothetical protein
MRTACKPDLILSLLKNEVQGTAWASWFDKLTMRLARLGYG